MSSSSEARSPLAKPSLSSAASVQVRAERGHLWRSRVYRAKRVSSSSGARSPLAKTRLSSEASVKFTRSEVTAGEDEVIERSECQVHAKRGHRWRSRGYRAKRLLSSSEASVQFERSESPLAKPSFIERSWQVRAKRGHHWRSRDYRAKRVSSSSGASGEAEIIELKRVSSSSEARSPLAKPRLSSEASVKFERSEVTAGEAGQRVKRGVERSEQ